MGFIEEGTKPPAVNFFEEQFGEKLYELEQASNECFGVKCPLIFVPFRWKQRAVFYKEILVIQKEFTLACYPTSFTQEVIMKYKISGVSIRRAQVPLIFVPIQIFFFIQMIVFFSMQTCESDGNFDEYGGYTETQNCSRPGTGAGVVFLFLWLLFWLVPFCFTHYYTEFEIAQPTKENSFASLLREFLSSFFSQNKIVVRTFFKPDENFLFHYVYGVMSGKMSAYHAFSHLNNDGLSRSFMPTDIGQITQLKNEHYVPFQVPLSPVSVVQGNPVVIDHIAGNLDL